MKLKIKAQRAVSTKGTHIYETEIVKASAPFVHLVLSRETFDPGDIVNVNTQRGALSVTTLDDGTPVMNWWV